MSDPFANKQDNNNRFQRENYPWSAAYLSNNTEIRQNQKQLPSDVDPWDLDGGMPSSTHKNQYVQEWLQAQQQHKQQQQQYKQHKQQQHLKLSQTPVRLQNPTLIQRETRYLKHKPSVNIRNVGLTDKNAPVLVRLSPSQSPGVSTLDSVLNLARHPPPIPADPLTYDTVKKNSTSEKNRETAGRESWLISFEQDLPSSFQNDIFNRRVEPTSCLPPPPLPHCQKIVQNKNNSRDDKLYNCKWDNSSDVEKRQLNRSSSRERRKKEKSKSIGDEKKEYTGMGNTAFSTTGITNDLSKHSGGTCRRKSDGCSKSVEELSMLFEHCNFHRCINFVSKYTRPYCHEHVGVEVRRDVHVTPDVDQTEMFSVMLNSFCRVAGCTNMTSRNVYPFCYEHLDHHGNNVELSNPAVLEQEQAADVFTQNLEENLRDAGVFVLPAKVNASTMTDEAELWPNGLDQQSRFLPYRSNNQATDLSILPDSCAVVGCRHFTSCYTRPIVYEHHKAANSPRQPIPVVMTRKNDDQMERSLLGRDSFLNTVGPVDFETTEKKEDNVQQQYLEAMLEIEERVRRVTPRCHFLTCLNYGNQPCSGFCHACYVQIGRG